MKMARFQITLIPVSYTHLDVYKRQGWGSGFSLYGFMLIPVIYYIACIHMKSRIGVVTSSVLGIFDLLVIVHSASSAGEINKLPGMSNHETVSYTHLDVYKRQE